MLFTLIINQWSQLLIFRNINNKNNFHYFKACTTNPCQNGGLCQLTDSGFNCRCKNGSYGLNCQF